LDALSPRAGAGREDWVREDPVKDKNLAAAMRTISQMRIFLLLPASVSKIDLRPWDFGICTEVGRYP
jgi:hypothetical protein